MPPNTTLIVPIYGNVRCFCGSSLRQTRYFHNFTTLNAVHNFAYFGHQWLERDKTIIWRDEDNNAQSDMLEVVLVAQILICGYENIYLTPHQI